MYNTVKVIEEEKHEYKFKDLAYPVYFRVCYIDKSENVYLKINPIEVLSLRTGIIAGFIEESHNKGKIYPLFLNDTITIKIG